MTKKKTRFGKLKVGQKFRFNRRLYVKDQLHCATRLSDGYIASGTELDGNTLVTPVKIKITVVG